MAVSVEEFVTRWPNYCRACGGWGSHSWNESVPYGMGNAAMPMSEPCDKCSDAGKCPRCGEAGLTSEDSGNATTGDGPCSFCKWDNDDGIVEEYEIDESEIPE